MYSTSMKKLLSLLTVFALVFGMIAIARPMQASAATVEIPISNGDFETGAFGGAVAGSNGATIVEKATYEGNYALKFDATGEILTVTGYLAEATTAESTVTLSFWAKVLAGSTQNSVNFGLFATNESWGNRVQKYGAGYPIVGGDWKQISQAMTVPAGTKIIQAQIYLGAAGATAIVDNISITDGNGNELLQSGGFEKGALNGDFNANDALEIVCTPVHSGNYAAHADKSSGNGNISTTVSIEPSSEARTVTFSYWMFAPTSVNSAHNMVVCFDTSSGGWTNLSTKYGAQYATPGQWVQKTMEIAVAANTNTLQIQLYAQDAGADFYIDDLTLTEEVEDVALNHDVTLSFAQVTGDGTWQFSISEVPANKYYKVPATIDGVACNILMGESGGIMCIYPSFFTALGGAVPTQQIIIAEGTVLKAVDSANGWQEIEGADTLTVAEKIDLSYVDGAWSKTVYTTDVTLELSSVQADGTWQLILSPAAENKYYKAPVIIDGTQYNILLGESDGLLCIYPNFFTALGGAVPTESLVIPAGTIMKPVVSDNGWKEIDTVNALKLTNDFNIENNLGSWQDMSQYADVTFEEITADDLIVYKWEDQAASNYRSVLGIYAPNAQFGNDAGWHNFTKVAGKVLIDGAEVSVVYGMAPSADDDSSWGANNAILLYITGEGYWDAVTTASSVTVCAGTMLISGVDNTKGVRFAEDFVMYKNCDGSWDTTADTHVYNQQNTELEGALVSEATCQSAAVYYYSCACGALSSETFTTGELGDHDYVNGSCSVCGAVAQEITLSLQTVTSDTWQLVPSVVPANTYYKATVLIDGSEYDILMQYSADLMLIYNNFFTALNGKVPTASFVIPANTVLKPMVLSDGWTEIEDAAVLLVTEELKIEKTGGQWVEMSKYSNVVFKEIYGADLDLYYQNIMRLSDYSDSQINTGLLLYPEYRELYEHYGRDANMTTFGFVPNIPTLQIPNDANWSNFTLLGTVSVAGAEPWETYVMQTPDSSDDAETAMTNGFLVRFYNGFVADQATSVTIEPGTKIVTKDGSTGFVFVDGYTIYRDADGNWSDVAPAGTNPVSRWSLLLADNIGVVFEMNTLETDTVTFTVNGAPVAAQKDGNTYTVYLAAAQMTDQIEIFVNGVAVDKTYSVRAYADIILSGGYGDLVVNLVKQMLSYGGASQRVFGYNTGNYADDGINVTAVAPTGDGEIQVSGSVSGITFYGASLLHRTKTAVRIYFTAQSVEDLNFTVNGEPCDPSQKDGLFYVEIDGINPQELGSDVTVTVTDGADTLSIAYSPMDYIVRMYNKAGVADNTKALVQALYGYYLAAVDYTA
ncbi:MAG: carbohydrate binding domain-containing protein [Oscillospiraceae bacterium]|nr:carbohydrate binding domain-containing protein [Oscillospiraceae bacterium]